MRIEGTNLLLFNQIHARHCFIFKNDYVFTWTKHSPELRKKNIKMPVTEQKWYFAIIDVIEILTESHNPRRYWSDLKRKLNSEGFYQLYEIIVQLIMIYQKQRKKRIKKGGKKIASTKLAASF